MLRHQSTYVYNYLCTLCLSLAFPLVRLAYFFFICFHPIWVIDDVCIFLWSLSLSFLLSLSVCVLVFLNKIWKSSSLFMPTMLRFVSEVKPAHYNHLSPSTRHVLDLIAISIVTYDIVKWLQKRNHCKEIKLMNISRSTQNISENIKNKIVYIQYRDVATCAPNTINSTWLDKLQ